MKLFLSTTILFMAATFTLAQFVPPEKEISMKRSVIRFLINQEYIVEDFIYQWERLLRRQNVSEQEYQQKIINEATIWKAVKKYQEDNDLTPTGFISNDILRKVFGRKYENVRIYNDALHGDYSVMKSYGEDDPNIGLAPKFKKTLHSLIEGSRKKRSAPQGPPNTPQKSLRLFDKVDEKKTKIFIPTTNFPTHNPLIHTQL
jgi:hypothetical protein